MSLFLSTFRNKLDKKSRVSVPASFRTALAGQTFQGIVAFRSLALPAVEGFGMDRMEKLSQHIDRLDLFSDAQQDWAASIFADAQPLGFDNEGRITLPDYLCQHAQLTDEVVFVGRGPTFQIWNPQNFAHHQEEARKRLLAGRATSSFGALS